MFDVHLFDIHVFCEPMFAERVFPVKHPDPAGPVGVTPHGDTRTMTTLTISHDLVHRRRRLVASVLLAVLAYGAWLAIAALLAGFAPRHADAAPPTGPAIVHIVQPGDTLWSIAADIDTDDDPRDTVDRLADLHGGVAIEVGTRLVLPDVGS